MTKSYKYLLNRMSTIASLKKLKETVDPASGMSLEIKRGPIDVDDEDASWREVIELETSTLMPEIIDLLIQTQEESALFWSHTVREDIDNARKAIEAYEKTTVN